MTARVPETEPDATVVDANGQRVATVTDVDDGVPYVEPADDVDTITRLALGWHEDSPPHRLVPAHVETVADDTIHLKGNL